MVPQEILSRVDELPFGWLREIVKKAGAKTADGVVGGEALEDLAMQFYKIELGEQRRLNGIMEHHSNESFTTVAAIAKPRVRSGSGKGDADEGNPDSKDKLMEEAFPYSITAGVEKGAKNR